jgi:tRNA dimethylallyltransferase
MQKPRIIFLVGPTGVGKSDIAVSLAKKLHAEIISCDSMQIYKGMEIIASLPSGTLLKRIPHHLLSYVLPEKDYDVSRFRREAIKAIKAILKEGKLPLLVGGTGLYMTILMDGIFTQRGNSPQIRKQLYKELETIGKEGLYRRLKRFDSKAAGKIHPNDVKRVIRALEVFVSIGRPISALQKERVGLTRDYDVQVYCLNMDRSDLYDRIDRRVEKMFAKGLLKEVKKLLKKKISKTAFCAIGIKELKGFFDGLYDLEEAKRLMKRNTRHYAKRQLTWFRKDKRIKWVEIKKAEKPQQVAKRIFAEIKF